LTFDPRVTSSALVDRLKLCFSRQTQALLISLETRHRPPFSRHCPGDDLSRQ
jgi:hypothetical protein